MRQPFKDERTQEWFSSRPSRTSYVQLPTFVYSFRPVRLPDLEKCEVANFWAYANLWQPQEAVTVLVPTCTVSVVLAFPPNSVLPLSSWFLLCFDLIPCDSPRLNSHIIKIAEHFMPDAVLCIWIGHLYPDHHLPEPSSPLHLMGGDMVIHHH